jgi:AraC-like DNA-binding protein
MAMRENMEAAPRPRFQNPAPPTFRRLYRGDGVDVLDWRCPGCDGPTHDEEYNDACEVIVVREGAFVREVAGSSLFATGGTLLFSAMGEVHRTRHPVPGGDACSVFQGSLETLREMLALLDPGQQDRELPHFPLRQAPLGGREYLLHRLAMRAAATGADPVEQEESALWFLYAALAFASARRHGQPKGRKPVPRRALEYSAAVEEVLRRGFASRLTLAEIGRAVQCSPFHLSRMVRAVTGRSIHQLLVCRRLRYALEQVLGSRDGLSAIAHSAGFVSHSHLTDAFRREYGCSPDRVRRMRANQIRLLMSDAVMDRDQPGRRPKRR